MWIEPHPIKVCLALIVLALCLLIAVQARADPMALRIVNNDPTLTIDAVKVWMDDLDREVPVACAPLSTCTLPVLPYPLGCYDLRAQVRAGGVWSDLSPILRNVAFDPSVCHDADADGRVTTSDFGSFLRAFQAF